MLQAKASPLIQYGLTLVVLAIALIAYDPQAHRIALYWTAKTGFFIGTGTGLALVVCGLLARAGKPAALWTGIVLAFLAMLAFGQKAAGFWNLSIHGEPHKSFAALVSALMALACLFALLSTARGLAFTPTTKSPRA